MSFSNEGFVIKLNREEEGLGLGFVRFTRGLGRKRILISKSNQETNSSSDQAPVKIELKRQRNETAESDRSFLESLHQDILIRVLCHVDHEDLSRLKRVSKTIRKAVMEAKKSHFDYSTPKKRLPFQDALLIVDEDSNSNSSNQDDEIEPPNAPIRRRNINRESDLSKISMVLFK
ncbi:F-box protein [Cardamine amara subsp. amara]|uniref:F-box protein n=1 Tax=Cardamine amara subsp. amara TaxID=228776 RepID=A0ABD1BXH3_CARAN